MDRHSENISCPRNHASFRQLFDHLATDISEFLDVNQGKLSNYDGNESLPLIQWSGDPITLPLIKITRPLSDDLLFYAFPFGFWLVTLDGEIKAQGFYQTDGVF